METNTDTKTDTTTLIQNVVRFTTLSVKPDSDSTSKKITVETTFHNVPLDTVITDALRTDNIRFQRELRTRFDTLTDGETIKRTYGAKSTTVVITDEMARSAYITKLQNMTPDERVTELEKLANG